ncbi:hypothetical protein FRC12_001577 [Ceratobasidium sp. 428]|nr:hypothetical protein FRC12_001577 [Ceratobasidium sp. 428]
MAGIKSDPALFEGVIRHWETARTPIEMEKQPTSSRLGRNSRRDTNGRCLRISCIIYMGWSYASGRRRLCGSTGEFREVFAGLMMLDEEAFGYYTALIAQPGRGGRLELYVDLPDKVFQSKEGAVAKKSTQPGTLSLSSWLSGIRKLPTQKFRVVEWLCHRKSIRGHASISWEYISMRSNV